jgi:hypothetical protein
VPLSRARNDDRAAMDLGGADAGGSLQGPDPADQREAGQAATPEAQISHHPVWSPDRARPD